MRLRYGIIMYIFSDYDDDVRLLINFDLTKSAPYSEPLFDLQNCASDDFYAM